MIDLRKIPPHPGVGKTNLSANVPMQLTWDFETGLVTEEDPNDEPPETDDTSTNKETP